MPLYSVLLLMVSISVRIFWYSEFAAPTWLAFSVPLPALVDSVIARRRSVVTWESAPSTTCRKSTPWEVPDSVPTLNAIAAALANTPYDIRVEGHTDNVPIHTDQFQSNWELSAARATQMTRIFVVDHGFAPHRLSASGYAEFHPVATNSTGDGRSQNRRVDIIVLPVSLRRRRTRVPII
jgi:OmpA family